MLAPMRGDRAGSTATAGPEVTPADSLRIVDYDIAVDPVEPRGKRVLWWLANRAWLVTAALCGFFAVVGIRGGDFPAQDYRDWLFGTHGFVIWDLNWYGGHAALGYSVLFPPVGWLLGAALATALACVASSVLFGRLVGPADNWPAVLSRLAFAVFVVGDLIVGRAPFACAVTSSLAAVLAVRARRPVGATAAAVVTSLFSPLGAAFLVLIAVAWAPTIGWRRAAPFAGAFVGLSVAAIAGDGGFFPFPWTAFVGQVVIVVLGLVVAPRYEHAVRRTLVLYGLACVVLFFVPNPVGGNMARLAGLVILPAATFVLLRDGRARTLLVVAPPLIIFQLLPVVAAITSGAADLSTKADYYQGMLPFLESHQQPLGRVEIPFTRNHWEAKYVAEHVALARGWERQTDLGHNAALYAPLSADAYKAWLYDNAVRYVALPDAPLDQGGKAEKAVLQNPPAWLRPVYSDAHWKIWQVDGATPLASGTAAMTTITPSGFTLTSSRTGVTLVRLRWSPYWHVDVGSACVTPTASGWTTVVTFATGKTEVSARPRPGENNCTPAQLVAAGLRTPNADPS